MGIRLSQDLTIQRRTPSHQLDVPKSTFGSLVKLEVLVVLHGVRLVALLKVGGKHDVPVVAHRLHARLLHDAMNLGARNLRGHEASKPEGETACVSVYRGRPSRGLGA